MTNRYYDSSFYTLWILFSLFDVYSTKNVSVRIYTIILKSKFLILSKLLKKSAKNMKINVSQRLLQIFDVRQEKYVQFMDVKLNCQYHLISSVFSKFSFLRCSKFSTFLHKFTILDKLKTKIHNYTNYQIKWILDSFHINSPCIC